MPSGSPSSPSGARGSQHRAVRACAVLLRTLYAAVALFGVLVTPPVVMLLVVPGLTLGVVALLAALFWYCQEHGPPRETVSGTAGATVAVVPFVQAVHVLEGLGTVVLFVVLGLLTVVGTGWLNSLPVDATSAPTARPPQAGGEPSLRDLLNTVPLETVFDEWRALQQDLDARSRPSDPAVARARALLLDEMQRRDPAGFSTWLAGGATEPPDGYISDDQGLPA